MTTNNHPAHGPVSLERLHQIREILSKAAAQSDGGNLGYAIADAVKVIDGAIAAFGAEPVLYAAEETLAYARMGELHLKCLSQPMGDAVIPLYVHRQATDEIGSWNNHMNTPTTQAGNSPVTPDAWIPVIERMPLTPYENCLYEDVEVQVFAGDDVFIAHYAIGALPEPWSAWVDTSADITHWMPLAEPPRNK
ncbi:DUF551 domain-containing protein [Citrobacter portucalensis]|uniref:DUF551 domain-containing protein n=1 Tax=Citrobacter portucalensis TaxID=1639133 RepID=UPI001F390DBD|nr:DUF551 domain-containing protein [Citrobacter portucalensis]MCE9797760.1 DUF551 domain-containing protein [Citrobacter portucalensis]